MKRTLLVLLVSLGTHTQPQAQTLLCDSLEYTIGQSQMFSVSLDTSAIWISMPVDSIEVLWSVCNTSQCYTESGINANFQLIQQTDTIKVCYDAYFYYGNTMEYCYDCDSLIYDQNMSSWVLFSTQPNPTAIEDLVNEKDNNNKTYDMLGRELFYIPIGKMYIQNRKVKIKK